MVSVAPSMNSNAQAALMILLTAQMQSQQNVNGTDEGSNLLQNPQVVGVLQNLVNQAADPATSSSGNLNEILSNPALGSVFGPTGLEPKEKAVMIHPHIDNIPSNKTPSPTPPIIANNLNNLLNAQNLKDLLGSLAPNESTPPPTSIPNKPQIPTSSVVATSIPNQRPLMLTDPSMGIPPPSIRPPLFQSIPVSNIPGYPPSLPGAGVFYQQSLAALPIPSAQPNFANFAQRPPFMPTPRFMPPPPPPQAFTAMPPPPPGPIINTQQILTNMAEIQQQHLIPQPFYLNGVIVSSSPTSSSTSSTSSTPPSNRIGKRKLTIPPSPEQSPEGPYIGQHSQGIGGHYADSYWKKRAKFN